MAVPGSTPCLGPVFAYDGDHLWAACLVRNAAAVWRQHSLIPEGFQSSCPQALPGPAREALVGRRLWAQKPSPLPVHAMALSMIGGMGGLHSHGC